MDEHHVAPGATAELNRLTRRQLVAGGAAAAVGAAAAGSLAGAARAGGRRSGAKKDSLVYLSDSVAEGLDMDGASAADPNTQLIVLNTYDMLIEYPTKRNAAGILVPDYSVDWDGFAPRLAATWKKRGQTWTFTLRKGVRSAAGNELTADDVIWTFQRAMSVSGASPVAWFLGNVSSVLPLAPVLPNAKPAEKQLNGEVTKVDRYTVRFKQSQPNELFPRVLEIPGLPIYDSKEMKKHATAADPWAHTFANTQGTAGFGPYTVDRWTKGSEIVLKANPRYYRGQPQYRSVTIRKVAQNANRVAAIRSGQADAVFNLTPREFADVAKDKNVDVLGWYNTNNVKLVLNFAFEPWSLPQNRKLRQAIAYAMPYDDIIGLDYFRSARQMKGLVSQVEYGFKPINRYRTDLSRARQLMTEAGFPGGKGIEKHADGLKLYYVSDLASLFEPLANRLRTALAQIGIPVTLAPVTNAEFSTRVLIKRDLPMVISDPSPPLGPDVGYASQLEFVSVKAGGLSSPANYENPKVDELTAQSKATTGAERRRLLAQIQDILMEDLPEIPLVERQVQLAVRRGITNWYGHPTNMTNFWYMKSA